jgi:hypothetical protein
MSDSKKLSLIVLSYVPLLRGVAGQLLDISSKNIQTEELFKYVDEIDSSAIGCLWTLYDSNPNPVFIYENAHDIHKHLVEWSENEPLKWFQCFLRQRNDKYLIALIPDLKLSTERFKIAFQLRTGYPVPSDAKINVIFKPLHFVSGTGNTTFKRVTVGHNIHIGFINEIDVDIEHPENMSEDKIRWIGPYKLSNDSSFNNYINKVIDDAKQPKRPSIIFKRKKKK